jgi:hypothetical protein
MLLKQMEGASEAVDVFISRRCHHTNKEIVRLPPHIQTVFISRTNRVYLTSKVREQTYETVLTKPGTRQLERGDPGNTKTRIGLHKSAEAEHTVM